MSSANNSVFLVNSVLTVHSDLTKLMLETLKLHATSSRFAESDDGRPVVAVCERRCAHGVCVYRVKQRDKRCEQQVGTHSVPHTPRTDSFLNICIQNEKGKTSICFEYSQC